jgi:DNA-binding MarR family transcriptional regulator
MMSASYPPVPARAAEDLRVAAGRIVRRLRQEWETGELTAAELSMLLRLGQDGPCGPAALAEAERVTPPVVCSTIGALERRGLVQRDPDPRDGRRILLSLTPAGRTELTARRSALSRRVATALIDGFTPAERQQLIDAVPLLDRLATQL